MKKVLKLMDDLNKRLLSEAVELGLCSKWQKEWKSEEWSRQELIDKMYEGLDFCIAHHWPSNAFIKQYFPKPLLRNNNVFVDDKYSALNPVHCLILGGSRITCRYNGVWIGNVHVRDTAEAIVTARNRSFCIIHLYDNAHVSVKQMDTATVVVIKHSNNAVITADGDVKIKEENLS